MMRACPVCGSPDGSCTGATSYFDPTEMEDLDPMQSKAVEGKAIRFPLQSVRDGRGVPGYFSNGREPVEVYDPETGKNIKGHVTVKQREPEEDK
jgi:hypothetical protein